MGPGEYLTGTQGHEHTYSCPDATPTSRVLRLSHEHAGARASDPRRGQVLKPDRPASQARRDDWKYLNKEAIMDFFGDMHHKYSEADAVRVANTKVIPVRGMAGEDCIEA